MLQYEVRSTENKESYDKIYKGKKEDRHHSVAFIPFFHPAQFKWYNTMRKTNLVVATLTSEMRIQNATNNVRSTDVRPGYPAFYSPLSSTAEALEINGCSFATRPQRLRRITSIPAFSVYRMHVGRSPLSSLPAVCWPERRFFFFDRLKRDEVTSKSHGHPVAGPIPNDSLAGYYCCLLLPRMSSILVFYCFLRVQCHPILFVA